MSARLADIITFSSVDGPGNRFVIFLQGCNFDCISCHNPHTIPLSISVEPTWRRSPTSAWFAATDTTASAAARLRASKLLRLAASAPCALTVLRPIRWSLTTA